jgi:hypothetical protein
MTLINRTLIAVLGVVVFMKIRTVSPELAPGSGRHTKVAAHTSLSMADYLAMFVEKRYKYSVISRLLSDKFDE